MIGGSVSYMLGAVAAFVPPDSKKSTGLAMTHERLMISTNLILAMVRDEAGTPFELTEARLDAM